MVDKLRVVILSHDLSKNNLGRAYLLACVFQRFSSVKIVGLKKTDKEIWKPLENSGILIDIIEYHEGARLQKLMGMVNGTTNGDIIVACKPYVYSLGVGLYAKFFKGKTLLLDIDDWEWGLVQKSSPLMIKKKTKLRNIKVFVERYIQRNVLDRLGIFADHILVSNSFLREKYGGTLFPHYKDTVQLHPGIVGSDLRAHWSLPSNKKIILFVGTPRSHKGLEVLVEAFGSLMRDDGVLVIVGINSDQEEGRRIVSLAGDCNGIYLFPEQCVARLPEILAMAYMVVIPQLKTAGSIGQVPSKLFDAMAMGKAVISTCVSDIPTILSERCGLVVAPNDTQELATAIEKLLDDPELCRFLGQNARKKVVEQFSFEVAERALKEIIYHIH